MGKQYTILYVYENTGNNQNKINLLIFAAGFPVKEPNVGGLWHSVLTNPMLSWLYKYQNKSHMLKYSFIFMKYEYKNKPIENRMVMPNPTI